MALLHCLQSRCPALKSGGAAFLPDITDFTDMKGFFAILLVVCGVLAAGWFFYEPYVKPLLSRFSSDPSMSDHNRVINSDEKKPVTSTPKPPVKPVVTLPVKPSATGVKPAEKPVAPVAAPKSELEQILEVRYPMPQILPLLTIVDQWRNVPSNAYPPEVTAKETIPFELVINGQVAGSSNVAPGTPLKPVRLEGDQLVIASLVNPAMSKSLAVDKTDFKERIEARYNQFVAMKLKDVEAKRARARQMIAADPSRLAILTGKAVPAPAASGAGDDPRFAAVKASLKSGQAASVTLEEADSFQWNGSEKIGGEFAGTYDTVSVHFVVSTIFGKFPTEYKALLKGGQVVGWIDPVTEDRI